MTMKVDEHVQSVLEFMQTNVPASKLMGVASAVQDAAPLLWSRYQQYPVIALELESNSLSISCEKQPIATESAQHPENVGDGSVEAGHDSLQ